MTVLKKCDSTVAIVIGECCVKFVKNIILLLRTTYTVYEKMAGLFADIYIVGGERLWTLECLHV